MSGAPDPEEADGRARLGRWLLTLVAVAAVVALFASGAAEDLDVERTAARVRDAGALGVVVYLLAFGFVQPLGVSGHVFVLSAAVIWPPWVAFPLALTGALGSALVSYGFARYVAHDWVQARLPARVRRYEEWIVRRGLFGVFVVRLLTFTMHPVQLLMGVVRVRLRTMLAGTALGFAPTVALDVWLGGAVIEVVLGWLAG